MILVFADDCSVTALDDITQANVHCEVIDVQDGVFTFIDEHATVLRPAFPERTKRTLFGSWASPDTFTLVPTQEQRPELLQAIFDRQVSVSAGPRIRTYEELVRELGRSSRRP